MTRAKVCPECGVNFTDSSDEICPRCLEKSQPDETRPMRRPGTEEDVTLPPKTADETTPAHASDSNKLSDDVTTRPETDKSSGDQMPATEVGDRVRYFGEYELLEEIARGGMGIVWKARQIKLNRLVALKMILSGQLASQQEVQRFYIEAEAAANLDHPGIVPIHEIGEHSGQHFFSMGFIDGESLADRVKEGPMPPREAADITRRVAEAIAYAHQHNVIHRDLKPGNILIDQNGDPRVTDFGLAKKIEGGSELTASGQILGTPSFMPPEQAAGNLEEVDERADVYSLGAILYALVTGRAPFLSANPMDTLMQVLEQEPVSPRKLNAQVPRDLETICQKCLEKKSSDRYKSAQEMADDLDRFLRGEPIAAKPPRLNRLVRLWIHQNIGAIGWAAVIGSAFGFILAYHTLQTHVVVSLRSAGTALTRYGTPSEFHPLLTSLPETPIWLHTMMEAFLVVLLATTGFLVAALVRPRNRPADVIAGLLSGFFSALVLFLMCFSWQFAYQNTTNTQRDLFEAAQISSANTPTERLMRRYPALRHTPRQNQAKAAFTLIRYRQYTRTALGVWIAFTLTVVICIPTCLCETMLAGWLLRREEGIRAAVVPYVEIALPAGALATIIIMLQVLGGLGFVQSSVPTSISLVLCLPLTAGIVTAIKRPYWPIRVIVHAIWVASLITVMIMYAMPPGS